MMIFHRTEITVSRNP